MRLPFIVCAFALFFLTSCDGGGGEKTTPNGFTFINHTNTGGVKPNTGDQVIFHVYEYHDGKEVGSSRDRGVPVSIALPDLSKGPDMRGGQPNPLVDAVSVMGKGDSATVIVPIDEKIMKRPNMAGVKELKYSLILEDVMTPEELKVAQEAQKAERKAIQDRGTNMVAGLVAETVKNYAAGNLDDKIQTTASGLKYQIIEPGSGEQAVAGKKVDVHYYGTLTDGTRFDDSFSRARPFTFPLGKGQVIKGWDEGIALLKEGAKAFLFVPAELGYGAANKGTNPPNSELIFYVELLDVK